MLIIFLLPQSEKQREQILSLILDNENVSRTIVD